MQGGWIRETGGDLTVVFLHGVLSGSESAWTHINGTYWPRLLSDEPATAAVGIYCLGYKTNIFSADYDLGKRGGGGPSATQNRSRV
jgi:hypothetical protein